MSCRSHDLAGHPPDDVVIVFRACFLNFRVLYIVPSVRPRFGVEWFNCRVGIVCRRDAMVTEEVKTTLTQTRDLNTNATFNENQIYSQTH